MIDPIRGNAADVRPGGARARRARVIVGTADVALHEFLRRHQVAHDLVGLDTFVPEAGDVLLLPASYLAPGVTDQLIARCSGKARIVAHGATVAGDWARIRALFSDSLVASLGASPDEDPQTWMTTIRKLTSDDIFGISQYLKRGALLEHVAIRRRATRDRLLDKFRTFFAGAGLGSRVIDAIINAADELVLRALRGVDGDRDGAELAFGEEIRATAAMDDTVLGISVSDRCGRRYRADLAGSIASAFGSRRFEDVEDDFAVVVAARASTHLVVNVGHDGSSEFVCLISRTAGRRNRSLAEAPRSFSLFSQDSPTAANGW